MVISNKIVRLALVTAIMLGGIFISEKAFATNSELDIDILPVLEVDLNYTAPDAAGIEGELRTGVLSLDVSSNNRTGITSTMTMALNSTDDGATDLTHVSGDDFIPALTTNGVLVADFPVNYWGYSADNGETFGAIPAKDEAGIKILTTTNAAEDKHRDILIGVKTNAEKTAGVYENSILITVIANSVPVSFENAYKMAGKVPVVGPDTFYTDDDLYSMQDMSSIICDSVTVGEEMKVVDVRDNKTYWIAKFADGHCWMTQNLDFNLSTSVTLTNATTDLNSVTSWKPARNTVARGSLTSSNFPTSSAAYNAPYSYDEDEYYYYEAPAADGVLDSSDKAEIYSTLDDCVAVGHTREKCEHYHSGNIYNWSAAVASNGTSGLKTNGAVARDSICPKGWRLPMLYTARNESTGVMETSESIDLFNAYGMSHENSKGLSMEPFYFVRAGAIYNLNGNVRQEVGIGTRYWTSTVFDWAVVYFYGNSPSNIVERNVGQSIRCIAR